MIKQTASVVAIVGLGIGLAGCGKDSTKTGATGSTPASNTSTGTIASTMTFGGPAEFKTRPQGLAGLKKRYGVVFGKFTTTDVGGPVTIQALKNGQIDAAGVALSLLTSGTMFCAGKSFFGSVRTTKLLALIEGSVVNRSAASI